MAGTIITKKGMILIAKLLASNQELVFTRAAVGTGSAPHGWDPAGMIGLNQYKMDGKISSCHSENEEATVVFQISSTDVESGFVITEAGIFAEDPDEGEILYAYLDLSDDPQYVYAKNSVVQKFAEIEFKTVVGAIENITVITSPDALVTKEVFEKEIDALNNPEFEDYSAEGAEAPDARTAIEEIKSKKSIFGIMSNIKAALKGLVTLGEMKELLVNNGLCNIPGQYFLDAAFGKNLQDQVTDVNNNFYKLVGGISIPQGADLYSDTYKVPGNYYCSQDSTARTLKNCPIRHAFTMKVESSTGVASVFYPCQTIRGFNSGELFYRIFNGDTNSWMDDISYVKRNDMRPKELMPIGSYPVNSEIILNSDVTAFNKLIFLFGSPNSEDQGYITQEVYPWGFNSNELGVKQPYIGMSVLGEKVVFKWLSNTKIKYIVGGPTLRRIFGVRQA